MHEYGCPECGGDVYAPDATGTTARQAARELIPIRGPLEPLLELEAGLVLLGGPGGSGKSTLALFSPVGEVVFVCAEMSAAQARGYAARLGVSLTLRGDLDLEDPELGLGYPAPAYVVVDSLQAHPGDPLELAIRLRDYAHANGCAVFATSQVTKAGELAGREAIRHEADVVIELDDLDGYNRIAVVKNRFGPVATGLWTWDRIAEGRPDWGRRYYSIEGRFPNYRAVPYPGGRRTRFAALLAAAASSSELRDRLPEPPLAVAAVDAGKLYGDGDRWQGPPDLERRRQWSESHGLPFFHPEPTPPEDPP